MKKFLMLTLIAALLCSCVLPASANEWGLTGGIYDIVSDDNRYDGYTSIADDGNDRDGDRHVNHAIMSSRYHNVLIAAQRKDKVWAPEVVSTTAVYQPGDERGKQVVLTHENGGFYLVYMNPEIDEPAETYFFQHLEEGGYQLRSVRYYVDEEYSNSYIADPAGLLFFQSGPENARQPIGDAMWFNDGITLEEFNIEQTPRSMMEVRRANMVSDALKTDAVRLTIADTWQGTKNGRKLPVYSAPDKASFRSAEGKASVSMGGEVEILGTAEGWTLIQYEVSQRTSRIGWIEGEFAQDAALTFASVPLVAAVDTFLTDDPFVSQFAQTYIPAGAALTGLAQCGEYYAYVEFAQGSTLYRGFVPMKDLMTKFDRAIAADAPADEVCWDVIDLLVGKWTLADGSDPARMVLFADATYRQHVPGDGARYRFAGNFRLYAAGEEGVYEMVFSNEEGMEYHYTLTLNGNGTLTLSGGEGEGEGVYQRDEYSTYGNG